MFAFNKIKCYNKNRVIIRRKAMNIIEKIKEKFKEIFNKTKKGVAIGGTIAALGVTTACATDKETKIVDNPMKMEQSKDFKEQFKYDVESENEEKKVEQKIKELETAEDVSDFLKNLYVEQLETMMGNTDWKTADIELDAYLTDLYRYEFKPNQENLFSTSEHNVKVYQVKNTKKNVIDCVSLESEDGKTVPVEVSMDKSIDNSVLATMGTVIPAGLKLLEAMEKGNENDITDSQRQFINSVKEFQNTKENQKIEEKTQENPEKEFEYE